MQPSRHTTARRNRIFSQDQFEAFLLGECEEELALRIEEQLFTDEAAYERMQLAKASLLAREVEGRLSLARSRQLHLQLERSPQLRAEFAETQRVYRRDVQTPSAGSNRWFEDWFARGGWPRLALAVCVSALILSAGGIAFRQLRVSEAGSAARQSVAVSNAGAPAARGITFFLPAGVQRGSNRLPTLHGTQQNRPVTLQLEVRGDTAVHWAVSIRQGTHSIAEQSHLPVLTDGPIRYVSLVLPPGMLQPGAYTAQLTEERRGPKAGSGTAVQKEFLVVTP